MAPRVARRQPGGNQGGYTLPEVIIASTIATLILAALASVIFVSSSANTTWSPRLQASGQIRSFQESFGDDVASGGLPSSGFTGNPCPEASPAPAAPIVFRGLKQTNPSPPPATWTATQVSYWYDPGGQVVQRCVAGGGPGVVARQVTAFVWSIDRSSGNSIVVTITASDAGSPTQYSQTQTLRFSPHRDTP